MGATTPIPRAQLRHAVVVTEDRLLFARLRVLLEQDGFAVVEADSARPIASVRRLQPDIVIVAAEQRTKALCARMSEYGPVLDASGLTEAEDQELVDAIADVITAASDEGTQAEIVSLFGSDNDTYVDPHGLVAEEIIATDPREVEDLRRVLDAMELEIVDLGEQLSVARRSIGDAEGLKYAVELALARNRTLEVQYAAELQRALAKMESAFDHRVRELETEHERVVALRDVAHEAAIADVEAAGAAALSAQYLWFARQLRT